MNSQLKEQIKVQIAALEGAVPKEARQQLTELERSFGEVRREMAALNTRLKQSHDDCEAVRNQNSEITKQLEQAHRNLATLQQEVRRQTRSRHDLEKSLQLVIESTNSLVSLLYENTSEVELPPFYLECSENLAARFEADEAYQSAVFLEVIHSLVTWAMLIESDADLDLKTTCPSLGVVVDICDSDFDGVPDVLVDLL
jgi:septal ring factor EnvC (AmiA/AmiB activator)